MVQRADEKDLAVLAEIGVQLWPHHTTEDLIAEFSEIMAHGDAQFFLKYDGDEPVGFAQCQLRHDYVEGTETSPVGYLEGIFVKEGYRHRGYAGELLAACEAWARSAGCVEFASDCEFSNHVSYEWHQAMRFTEANRIICFTKKL